MNVETQVSAAEALAHEEGMNNGFHHAMTTMIGALRDAKRLEEWMEETHIPEYKRLYLRMVAPLLTGYLKDVSDNGI